MSIHPLMASGASPLRPRNMKVASVDYVGPGDELGSEIVPGVSGKRVLVLFVQYSNHGVVYCPTVALRWTGSDTNMFPVALAASGGNVAMNMVGCEFLGAGGIGLAPWFAVAASDISVFVNIGYLYL